MFIKNKKMKIFNRNRLKIRNFSDRCHDLDHHCIYIEKDLDVHKECMSYCRHHQINIQLWNLSKPSDYINFI